MPKGDFLAPELVADITASAAKFSTLSANPLSAALFHQVPFQGYGRYAIERSQVAMRSPFLAPDVVEWLYRAPAPVRQSQAATMVIARRPDLMAIPTDLGLLGTGPTFVRRASRRALIKAEYMTSHGASDWMARLSARLPAALLETRFLGVDKFHHFRYWIRRELADYVREALIHAEGNGLGEWFRAPRIPVMVNDHLTGRGNYTDAIDKLVTVTTIQNTLFGSYRQAREAGDAAHRQWQAIRA
jgi:hypothetical protein